MEIDFDQQDLIALVKMRPGKQWHTDQKRWSLPDTPENRAWAGIRPNLDHAEQTTTVAPAAVARPLSEFIKNSFSSVYKPKDSFDATPQKQSKPPRSAVLPSAAYYLESGRIFYKIDTKDRSSNKCPFWRHLLFLAFVDTTVT